MEITIIERFNIIGILPEKSDLMEMQLVKDIKEKLYLASQECEENNIVTNEAGGVSIPTGNLYKKTDFDLSKYEIGVIEKALRAIAEKREVTENLLSLFDLFNVK